jgi:histidine triad (HIT) family protein
MAEVEASPDCIFCQIVSGSTQADVVFDTPDTLFFRDISPKAPVHLIGIPKKHLGALSAVSATEEVLLGKLLQEITTVAAEAGIAESGYRVITNIGSDAGQEVPHLHFHILGGEPLGPLRSS